MAFEPTNGADTFIGTKADDAVTGMGGNDILRGGGGNDKLYGSTGNDRIDGGAGNDLLMGGKGVDALYGGTGNDTFAFGLNDFDASLGAKPQDFIYDFKGAGASGKSAGAENDFIRFTGFGEGSTLVKDVAASAIATQHNPGLAYYTLHDTNTDKNYTIAIKDGGFDLVSGDFGFYGSVAA